MSESSQSSQGTEGSQASNSGNSGNSGGGQMSKWSDVISKVLDKLIGKDLQVTYTFDNLEIDIPQARGPNGKELGSAKWKIDGKIVISTELTKGSGLNASSIGTGSSGVSSARSVNDLTANELT
jgi:hypothetical protein